MTRPVRSGLRTLATLLLSATVLAGLPDLAAAQKGGGGGGGYGGAQQRPPQRFDVRIVNRSEETILVVNISSSRDSNWGPDRLGNEVIPVNRTYRLQVPSDGQCFYDIRIQYQNGEEETRMRQDLCRTREYAFNGEAATVRGGNQQAQGQQGNRQPQQGYQQQQQPRQQQQSVDLVFANQGSTTIEVLNVSSSNDRNWGPDRLGSGVIQTGQQFQLTVPLDGCNFDIRVIYQGGQQETRMQQNVCQVRQFSFGRQEFARQDPDGDGRQQRQQNPNNRPPDAGRQGGGTLQASNPPNPDPPRPPAGTLISTGTGFYVSTAGHILTNRHVVQNCGTVAISRPTGERIQLTRVGEDAVNDLALLQISGTVTPTMTFRSTDASPVRPGDRVVLIGYPVRQALGSAVVTEGSISATTGPQGDSSLFQYSAPTQAGNSGGPVFDESGLVVGVVVARFEQLPGGRPAQNINFAIQMDPVRRFMSSLNVTPQEAVPGPSHRTADINERSLPAVLPLDCLS